MIEKLKGFIRVNSNYFFENENENDLINFEEKEVNKNCIHLKLLVDFY